MSESEVEADIIENVAEVLDNLSVQYSTSVLILLFFNAFKLLKYYKIV